MPLLHIPALPRHTTPCLTAPDQTGPDLAKTCRTEPGLAALACLISRRRLSLRDFPEVETVDDLRYLYYYGDEGDAPSTRYGKARPGKVWPG